MILIVAAMDEEVAAVSERMADIRKENHSHVHFIVGKLAGSTIVLMKSGVGKGSAAMSMSIAMEHYPVTQVFNVGTAGGLTKEEDVLDLVISSRVVQYDYDTSPLDGPEGKGLWFDADPSLMKAAMQVSEELMLRTHTGLIASGDRFVNRPLAYDFNQRVSKSYLCRNGSRQHCPGLCPLRRSFRDPQIIVGCGNQGRKSSDFR